MSNRAIISPPFLISSAPPAAEGGAILGATAASDSTASGTTPSGTAVEDVTAASSSRASGTSPGSTAGEDAAASSRPDEQPRQKRWRTSADIESKLVQEMEKQT